MQIGKLKDIECEMPRAKGRLESNEFTEKSGKKRKE